ncbi:hypothetical protein SAMN05216257_101133 [Meinhardsimonia xiamenensis]|uniref:Glutamine amidotransferase domain-containing protein n=2 Tax=Meinhardsimonia xiamenensis TaxID=990712 RepID=A0A1G8Y057_9RHOB|nr:hypothetical protein LV81_00889 [Meinhardsimonia xiamenensis]SDJ96141.1 hypothetical protein SAMN05216257_101133 [Meinhardsimonia xiamenensis]
MIGSGTGSVIFDPLLPWAFVAGLGMALAAFLALALWRGLSGWWLRAMAAAVVLAALANPSFQREEREALSDIVIAVIDESASQKLADRPAQTAAAVEALEAAVARLPNTELRVFRLGDGEGNEGTLLMSRLAEALAEEPRARLAGAVLVTDGQLHDIDRAPSLPAPLHVLLTGREGDWDRRLIVKNAPAFAILGETVTLTLRIEDQGAAPPADRAELNISVDGGEEMTFVVPVGEDLELPLELPHGGINVIRFAVPPAEGELTDRNNAAVVQINGVRDRLRVLLVSGEPHMGERVWRNLLKSDSAVDLVHFTILRPPEKQDGVPVNELSLIAFPTRELFLEKIDEFDLIVFDRYKLRGILPALYLDNVRRYVEAGGAVLVAAGPDFASAASLYRSPLGEAMPGVPTGRVIEQGFRPAITELGRRHPVTSGLEDFAPQGEGGESPAWGRWFRQVEVEPVSGNTVMAGIEGRPLLILDRVGEGRIALMASDHTWLWSRGFEGGGPQLELLRRLAHWMMKEPELEEEALQATAEGATVTIVRRTLGEGAREVTVTAPDGSKVTLTLEEVAPGRLEAVWQAPEMGLYRLTDGELDAVIAVGPAAPREFEATIAEPSALAPLVEATRGGVARLEEGMPDLRQVRAGRAAAGRGWLGITPRGAYVTADVTLLPLVSPWIFLMLAGLLTVGAWLREGRR